MNIPTIRRRDYRERRDTMTMPRINTTAIFIAAIIVLLIAFILSLFGAPWFMHSDALDFLEGFLNNTGLVVFANGIQLSIYTHIYSMTASNNHTRRAVALGFALFFPYMVIANYAEQTTMAWILVSMMPLPIALFLKRNISTLKTVMLFGILTAIINSFQFLLLFVKTGNTSFDYIDLSFTDGLFFSIDMLIFQLALLYFFKKWGEYNGFSFRMDFPRMEKRRSDKGSKKLFQTAPQESDKKSLQRSVAEMKDLALAYGVQIIELSAVGFAVFLNNRLAVFVVLYLAGFIPQRMSKKYMPVEYHHPNFIVCALQSILAFYMVCASVPLLNVSLFLPIISGVALAWGTSWFAVKLKGETSERPFRCSTATEDEIRARCLLLGKSDEYANFLVAVHRSGRTQKEIAADFGIATATCKEYKRKRSREIENVNIS